MRRPVSSLGILLIALLFATSCVAKKASPAADQPNDVRFVVWGDSQFSRQEVFERAVHETEMLRPDLVLQVGDLIQGYTYDREKLREEWRRYRAQIEPLTSPFYPVPGNHDVVTPESEQVYGEVWGEDMYYYSFDRGPAHFVVLDSFWQEDEDRIALWQREWLDRDLKQWAQRKSPKFEGSVFVFLHSPLWRYAKDHPGRQDWDAVEAILAPYPVRLIIGGHTHEHVYQQSEQGFDYLVMNTSGGMGGKEPRAGHIWSILHVSVDGDDIRYATIPAGSILPIDTVSAEERNSVPRYQLRGGTLRVPEWVAGKAISQALTLPLSNKLDEKRLYNLEWTTPPGSNITIVPDELSVELGPGESREITFQLTTPSAPPKDQLPSLGVTTEKVLRTGVVSREWEARYRERAERAKAGERVYTTHIPLEAPVTFSAEYDLFVPPVAEAHPAVGTITVDGNLDDEPWRHAAPLTAFSNGEDHPGEVTTEVRLLYDANYLYVAARLGEPHMAGTQADASGDIALTWNDDDLELFFDSDNGQNRYTRLFQNIAGTRFNSFPRDVENKYFKSTYDSSIFKGPDYWTLEMRIPWKETGAAKAPAPGDTWGFNVGRHRPQSLPAEFTWSAGLYDPARYGLLRFIP